MLVSYGSLSLNGLSTEPLYAPAKAPAHTHLHTHKHALSFIIIAVFATDLGGSVWIGIQYWDLAWPYFS